ncbi:putative periplasmic protein [Hydrogenimonas sp.]|nr:putative periplasmic protein [Hydrogenimonas sp.]
MRRVLLALAVAGVAYWAYIDLVVVKKVDEVAERSLRQDSFRDPVIEGMEARLYLNSLREKAGLPSFMGSGNLEKSAASHAAYLAKNRANGHNQSPSFPGFSGETPSDRAVGAGYPSRVVRENLSSGNIDFKDSVDGLFAAIYHRFGFLDSTMDEIGIAYAEDSSGRRIYVYDMGSYGVAGLCREDERFSRGKYLIGVCAEREKRISAARFEKVLDINRRQSPKIILWPYDGQEDVPPAFFEEIPDPLPEYSVSGYPISIIFNGYYFKRVKVVSFRLYSSSGSEEIPVRLMDAVSDPNLLLKKNQFAVFPLKRLEYGTGYTATVHYIADGKAGTKEWSFKTRSFDNDILEVEGSEATFGVVPGKSYVLYLKPHGPNDTLKKVLHPRGTAVEKIDANTLLLKISEDIDEPFVVEAGGRRVTLQPQIGG